VALSGYAQPEDRERSREAGFDAHLAKPIGIDEVNAVLAGTDSA
jgi:CheY-like chemotaxis protein